NGMPPRCDDANEMLVVCQAWKSGLAAAGLVTDSHPAGSFTSSPALECQRFNAVSPGHPKKEGVWLRDDELTARRNQSTYLRSDVAAVGSEPCNSSASSRRRTY